MRSQIKHRIYWIIKMLVFIAFLIILRIILPESWLRSLEWLG